MKTAPKAAKRLGEFMIWRDWSQGALAGALACSQTLVSAILLGDKRPGLEVAHAIECVTGEARLDGKVWTPGPIRTEEWLPPSSLRARRARATASPRRLARAA